MGLPFPYKQVKWQSFKTVIDIHTCSLGTKLTILAYNGIDGAESLILTVVARLRTQFL